MAPERIKGCFGFDAPSTELDDDDNDDEDAAGGRGSRKATALATVMNEVDAACRAQTRELCEAEGKGDLLGDGGVRGLQAWLEESKDKILGNGGHVESMEAAVGTNRTI